MARSVQAILLVGPTGSGKTPLGNFLEKHGFCGRRCVHFDFGSNLRRVAALTSRPSCLSEYGFRTVKRVLDCGTLLGRTDFHIAGQILRDFLRRRRVCGDVLLVLNGLPRRRSQASAVAEIVDVRLVVYLRCSPGTVMARIARNSGGDRVGRVDDTKAFVRKKLAIFRSKTLPLLDHYRRKGVKVATVGVRDNSTTGVIMKLIGAPDCFGPVKKEGRRI